VKVEGSIGETEEGKVVSEEDIKREIPVLMFIGGDSISIKLETHKSILNQMIKLLKPLFGFSRVRVFHNANEVEGHHNCADLRVMPNDQLLVVKNLSEELSWDRFGKTISQ